MREKRIFSVFLAVVLCVSMLPVSALADEDIILAGEELLSLVEEAVEEVEMPGEAEVPEETEESVVAEAPEETAVPEVTESPAEAEEEIPAAETEQESETLLDGSGFRWNGGKTVLSVLPISAQGLLTISDAMGDYVLAYGYYHNSFDLYETVNANGDPNAQVLWFEDAIARGDVGAIMCAPMDVDLLEDVALKAQDAGIAVVYLGADPGYPISGCYYTAYDITGIFAVRAAENWVVNRVAEGGNVPTDLNGMYEVAIDTYYGIPDGVARSEAVEDTVNASGILSLVANTSSYGPDAYTTAYNNARDVLGANPDCHIFIAYEPEMALGMADAIAEYCDDNGFDLADYCVISCYGEDETFNNAYDAACADASASAVKGYVNYGETPQKTGEHLAEIILSACNTEGFDHPYGEPYYDPVWAVNIYGYEQSWKMGDEYPSIQTKPLYIGDWDGNLTWRVEDGVMTLSGTGAMADFGWYEDENGEPIIRKSPWRDCFADVTKIIISEGITSVGESAFTGWRDQLHDSGLRNINNIELVLPESMTSVAESAFFGTGLGTVHIGSGMEDIPYLWDWAFSSAGYYIVSEDNPNYTAVDGVLYSKDGTGLLQIPWNAQLPAIPETVTSLGEGSLYGWAIQKIVLPDTVTSMGLNTISGNSTVTDVTFGCGVAAIPDSCLAWCPNLNTVTIPLEITAIGANAFEMVESLTDVYYEGTKAQWENISLGEGNTSLMLSSVTIHCSDGAYKYESLASGVCGDGLTWELSTDGVLTISGAGAMKDYGEVGHDYISAPWPKEYVTAIVLEDGITSIGNSAFAGCVNLGSVTIPDTVTSIGESAFFFPEGGVLGDVYFNGTETQWAVITIGEYNDALNTATLHCQTLYSAGCGIQITAENELADGVKLSVESVNEDDVDADVLVQIGDATCAAYNISLLDSDGAETQPDGSIEIRIPVPSKFNGEECIVYRAEENGTLTDMQAEYINGYMVFTTEHLSLYLLAQPKPLVLLGDVTGDGDINVQDLVRLMKYIAGMDVEVVESECDTNRDDKIDILDVIRLVKTLI